MFDLGQKLTRLGLSLNICICKHKQEQIANTNKLEVFLEYLRYFQPLANGPEISKYPPVSRTKPIAKKLRENDIHSFNYQSFMSVKEQGSGR